MDEKTIRKIIRLRFRRLKKYWSLVENTFDMDAVHDFRVEYKKLRAFLRLLSSSSDHKKIKIPHSLQDIYQYAGPVRDLQLHISNMEKNGKELGLPVNHLRRLRRKLASAKRQLKNVMQPEVLLDCREKIEKKIPGALEVSVIENFAGAKMTVVSGITSRKTIRDNDLHMLRKSMKDIIYNARTFESDLSVPFVWKNWNTGKAKCFAELATYLGRFQDSCTAMAHLKEGYENASGEEKELINNIKRKQQRQKNQLKRRVIEKFTDTHCFPA